VRPVTAIKRPSKKPFWDGRRPPRIALNGVSTLAQSEWLIEIEAVAVID
jgi:hypothetical protein